MDNSSARPKHARTYVRFFDLVIVNQRMHRVNIRVIRYRKARYSITVREFGRNVRNDISQHACSSSTVRSYPCNIVTRFSHKPFFFPSFLLCSACRLASTALYPFFFSLLPQHEIVSPQVNRPWKQFLIVFSFFPRISCIWWYLPTVALKTGQSRRAKAQTKWSHALTDAADWTEFHRGTYKNKGKMEILRLENNTSIIRLVLRMLLKRKMDNVCRRQFFVRKGRSREKGTQYESISIECLQNNNVVRGK